MRRSERWIFLVFLCAGNAGNAAETNDSLAQMEACLAESVLAARPEQTVAELRAQCEGITSPSIERRNTFEEAAVNNPFSILPHKPNYILPVSWAEINEEPYNGNFDDGPLDDFEVKYQVSLKYLAAERFLVDDLRLELAFTAVSWWQAYNEDASFPVRETNYQPELILNYTKPWSLFGVAVRNSYLSLNHQSNGQSGELSRGWTRLIAGLAFQHENLVIGLEGWYRVSLTDDGPDTSGKDNPDIEKYMGYGQLGLFWNLPKDNSIELLLRNNLRSDNKGAVELGWTFPLTERLNGYVQYFNGYGESLIYYNQRTERLGVGFKLTDWL